jgi:thioredoxin-related protein
MNISRCIKYFGITALSLVFATFLYAKHVDIQEVAAESVLDNVIKSNNKVVVFFYEPTCPVCNSFKKKGIYPATANALPDTTFVMVSSKVRRAASENKSGDPLFTKYDVKAFPSFVFFKNGDKINQFAGYSENPHFTNKVSLIFQLPAPRKEKG